MQPNMRNFLIILVVVIVAIWIVLPNNPGIHIGSINKDIETRLGLDLVGGVQALLEADVPADQEVTNESMRTATSIVENRVNGLGVTEAVVQQAGDRRIVVELPGETDPEAALAVLRQTGLLEFVDFSQLSDQEILALGEGPILTDFAGGGTQAGAEPVSDTIFNTVLTGTALESVQVVTNPATAQYQVSFVMKGDAVQTFREYTASHIGTVLAIVLDKRIISTPAIENSIDDGQGVITGNFTYESANALAIQLRYGSLPIPLKIVETRTVGPTLGQDSLQNSLRAGIIGFVIVILFMALYYRLPGAIADVSILIYAVIAFALFRYIPITLTLPGIAGFLLSTGSALDANILIFERMKEELRSGRSLRQAIDLGWQRAWPSIRDSNIATLITCGILFWFGSSFGATIVKGFSITLALGVAVSLFSALFISRTILSLVLNRFQPEDKAKWFGI